MSILTGFLYPLYWGHQNFRHLDLSVNSKFKSTFYALFLPISFLSLIRSLEKTAAEYGASIQLKAVKLAISYFILSALGKILDQFDLPIGGKLVAILSLVPLYQVQKKINAVNAELRPGVKPDNQFTPWDITGILVVAAFVALRIIIPRY